MHMHACTLACGSVRSTARCAAGRAGCVAARVTDVSPDCIEQLRQLRVDEQCDE